MGKDYWYIFALSATVSVITLSLNTYIVICLFFFWLLYVYVQKKISITLLISALLSFFFFYFYLPAPTTSTSEQVNESRSVFYGEIVSPIIETDKKIEFTFRDERTSEQIVIVYFVNDENELVEHHVGQLQYGAVCKIEASLSIPDGARNPYQFDYRLYLLKKAISYQIVIPTLEDITCKENHSLMQSIYSMRTYLLNKTESKLQTDTAAWLHALVLGHDGLLEQETIELFQRWSLSHILAISGLHIGIVVGIIYLVLVRFSITTKEKAQWIMMVFLPIYAILAGSQPSVWRASLMIVFVIFINKIKLKYNYTDILSIVFLLLIIIEKYIVYHIGFQLSFAVTFGLILSSKWIAEATSNMERVLQISFVSQMMILPLQIHYFSTFQPLSILLNVIVVPYFSLFVIPVMFIILLSIFLPTIVIELFQHIFLFIHQHFLHFIMIVDDKFNFPFIIGEIPISLVIIYYLLFVFLMISLEKRNQIKSFQYGMYVALFIIYLTIRPYFSPIGTVTMLDIGQGDAFVVELPYRKGVFIIDAGASFTFPDFKPSDRVYKQIIRPYLYGRGIHTIDAVFISHNDLDHDGSVRYIVEGFEVKEVIISPFHELDDQTITAWKEANVPVTYAAFNERMIRNSQAFHVLSPEKDKHDDNENSLVLYTELGGKSWLFTGDIGKETEKGIVKKFRNLQIDVLKVGHHGSNTSTDPYFLNEIAPNYALISAGVNNSYGHPTEEVLQTLSDEQIIIFRTDLHGAVQYQFKEEQGIFNTFFK
ncbi:DNA internalization-related competence protein ComEC/Rec2 [Pseudogracilibacillus auburnensis]|uniref:DNA internalization-related competence protein ComEC/Rec2 n=1 Tax=Pseudogracilibacillus auburnensis TaxID=1494959 RepID=UPI001A9583FC|nr:DNA internalization-related competence protein ComEC/Rec2 [Pseudogracilibacillus auburnensis]MBO1003460.1 DNA internalization-related competence protein ComEC/Rec2 [Pseudogracilibacillus auburnensis]